MRLHLVAEAALMTAAEDAHDPRALRGLALPYGAPGRTSAGLVKATPGRVTWPADLRRVKVFRGHGRDNPVGYLTGLSETTQGLVALIHIGATPAGDAALLEAQEGTVDALSVELDDVELGEGGEILSAALTGLALVPVPAFTDARLAAEDTAPDDDASEDSGDGDDTADDTDEPEDDPVTAPTDPDAPAVQAARAPAALTAARHPRGLTLDAAMRRVAEVVGRSPDANRLNAALADIIPGSDTSEGAFIRPQWIDEVWTAAYTRRPYVESISKATLTGMTINGVKWGVKPATASYTGNKTAVPSNSPTWLPVTADAVRHAGGWDVDRIFVDLGDGSILTAILQAAAADYAQDQEAYVSAQLQAEATDVATAAGGTLLDALTLLAQTLGGVGASPSFVAVASDLWGGYLGMTSADAPWWLTGSVDITEGTSSALGVRIWNDPGLPAGHVLGGDRRAATFYEPSGNPFKVQAVNLPSGGVDIGIFGYCAVLVNDDRALVDVTVTPAGP